MNNNIESQAKWYATRVVLVLFSIIATFVVIGYIDLFYLFVVIAFMFAIMIAGAIYTDAYYSKLMELERKNEP